ncbi:putative methyltransferase-like protein 24 [Saccoglossus kowalevskii]
MDRNGQRVTSLRGEHIPAWDYWPICFFVVESAFKKQARERQKPVEKSLQINRTFEYIDKLNKHQAWGLFYRYITEPQYKCKQELRMGNELPKDGGWTICLDVHVKPDNCYVYSFGIAQKWGFDDDMAEYGCNVYSFDPTIGLDDHKHSDNVWFYNMGLWDEDSDNMTERSASGWKCKTVNSIRSMLKHNVIDVLKIDIEGCERRVFPEILKSGVLRYVKQIAFELHIPGEPIYHPEGTAQQYFKLYNLLFENQGFKLFFCWLSPWKRLTDWGSVAGNHTKNLELGWINTHYL